MGFMALYTVTDTHEHCRISPKAYIVLTTIFSPCEQLHLHTQCSSNPSLLLSAPFSKIASSPFLMDNRLKTDLDPLELDQSGYPWLLNPVFANSPPLCSGKLRPPSLCPGSLRKCQVQSQAGHWTGYRTRVGRRKCNKPVPLNLHPSQAFMLTL